MGTATFKDRLVGGALAGGISRCIVAPMDLIKIRYQVLQSHVIKPPTIIQSIQHIYAHEGLFGFYKGNLSAQYMAMLFSTVQFGLYAQYKHTFVQSNTIPWYHTFVGASFAGVVATFVSYPFDILRSRLALQHSQFNVMQGLTKGWQQIVQQEGWRGMYAGSGITAFAIVPYMAIQFSVYESLASHAHSSHGHLLSGMIAGTCGKLCTMPLEILKRRQQVHGLFHDEGHSKAAQAAGRQAYGFKGQSTQQVPSWSLLLREIYMKEGIQGFFKGSMTAVLKAAPASGIAFAVFNFYQQRFCNLSS